MYVPVLHLDLLSRHLQRVSLLGLCRLEVEVERGLALLPPPSPPLRPTAAAAAAAAAAAGRYVLRGRPPPPRGVWRGQQGLGGVLPLKLNLDVSPSYFTPPRSC